MTRIVTTLLLSISLIIAAALIGKGISTIKQPLRVVTVKGLAEQDVQANLAFWPISFTRTGDDLKQIQTNIANDKTTLLAFLQQNGLTASDIDSQSSNVVDRQAQLYESNNNNAARYIVTATIMVRTSKINQVAKAYQQSSQLLTEGINQAGQPSYLFTELNQRKPQMIAAATDNARQAAEQFANDSHSQLGNILQADQGYFAILPRDKVDFLAQEQQINKTLRVVVTLKYQLNND